MAPSIYLSPASMRTLEKLEIRLAQEYAEFDKLTRDQSVAWALAYALENYPWRQEYLVDEPTQFDKDEILAKRQLEDAEGLSHLDEEAGQDDR